eukprot:COSAG05_NODE_2586_length_2871_cov_21.775758_1_plen_58_part_00
MYMLVGECCMPLHCMQILSLLLTNTVSSVDLYGVLQALPSLNDSDEEAKAKLVITEN